MTPREQTERALIGCVLEQPDLSAELNPEWFDDLRLSGILLAVIGLQKEGKPVDPATVANALNLGEYVMLIRESQEECHSAANFSYWSGILQEHAEKSRLTAAAQRFLSALPSANGDLRAHIASLENALAKPIGNESHTLTPKDSAEGLRNDLERRFNLQGKRSGLETGFRDLDKLTDGLQFGEFTILAARPSVGKTAIACNVVRRVCLQDKIPTLFLSLEMGASALCRRLMACHEGIYMNDLKTGRLVNDDFAKISAFDKTLKTSPLYIREAFGGMTGGEAAALIRRGAIRKGVKLVVLDYLQKLKPDSRHEKRTYEVADASASLVNAVRESGVAFLCLAQLNRESEREKGRLPRISDLADSGQIERDADNVLLLHRDRKNPDTAQLIVGKQRDGEVGIANLYFQGQFCRFSDMTREKPIDDNSTRNPTND